MKQWRISYQFSTEFTGQVNRHYYKLRCFPKEDATQRISYLRWSVDPPCKEALMTDIFGNRVLNGCCMEPHERFSVSVNAVITKRNLVLPEPAEYHKWGMMRSATVQTAMGDSLQRFYETQDKKGHSAPWGRASELMHAVYGAFSYVSGSTQFATTAEEAFSQGCGVCQDYAHILLALLRHENITVRYVAGAIPGEGQSHAWIEVLQDGFWKGFDPTHDRETDDTYISFVVGRDACDCGMNRGIFRNAAEGAQHVMVKMEEF